MNQDYNSLINESFKNLNIILRDNKEFKLKKTLYLNRLNELQTFAFNPIIELSIITTELCMAFKALNKLIELKMPHSFMSFLLSDFEKRFENVDIVYVSFRELHENDHSNVTPFNFKECFQIMMQLSAKNKTIKESPTYGLKKYIDCLMKSLITSNTARWHILTFIKSGYSHLCKEWVNETATAYEKLIDNHEYSFYSKLLDSREDTEKFGSLTFLESYGAIESLCLFSAYSKALLSENPNDLTDEHFPILKKSFKIKTLENLIADHQIDVPMNKIEQKIRLITNPETGQFKKFIHSKKHFAEITSKIKQIEHTFF